MTPADSASADAAIDWRSGHRLPAPPAPPLRLKCSLRAGSEVPGYCSGPVPLMARPLCDTLRACGVDNLEVFDALIVPAGLGQILTSHVCVNVVGLVRGAPAPGLLMFRAADAEHVLAVSPSLRERLAPFEIEGLGFEPF